MKKINKYTYYNVIQQNWGYGWDDVDFYECNSTGSMDKETRELYKVNIKAYRDNQPVPTRTIFRKETKQTL